ncbi:MAG: hypothetical protein M1816_004490 [Peltula sp. TS41687]|nr:MAG: hypothetical protein M1816_004490 [Peltula sp. TS41687]
MDTDTPNKISGETSTTLRGDETDEINHLDEWKWRQMPSDREGNRRKRPDRDLIYRKVLQAMVVFPSSSSTDPAVDGHDSHLHSRAVDGQSVSMPMMPSNAKRDTISLPSRLLAVIGLKSGRDRKSMPIFKLHDQGIPEILEELIARFGRPTHSTFLDASYSIYISPDRKAAICFKRVKKVAVAYGDPLCDAHDIVRIIEDFRAFCKRQGWRVAVIGGGSTLAGHALAGGWMRMEFAVEHVFNPLTNPVLDECAAKTIIRGNRRLFNSGIKLGLYDPGNRGRSPALEEELLGIYHTWRAGRMESKGPQTYSTVLNPFALPRVTRHLYTKGSDGKINGFASLMRMGASDGYLLEPCIAAPDAPKGITEFLTTHAMGLLRDEKVDCMTLCPAPLPEVGEMTGMPSVFTDSIRSLYRTTFNALGLGGKKVFYEKFKPEDARRVSLYMLFPPGFPVLRGTRAVLEVTHIQLREVWKSIQARSSKSFVGKKEHKDSTVEDGEDGGAGSRDHRKRQVGADATTVRSRRAKGKKSSEDKPSKVDPTVPT